MASTSFNQTPSFSTSSPSLWDVFLSFRGMDTRYIFTDHLYNTLFRTDIRTFRDDPELRSGEAISDSLLEAIQGSKAYIVVFSENYASSRWCLDELVEILSCRKTKKRLVIPVFYHIDPSVVRHQTKSFEKAFEKHQTRFVTDRLDKWRAALKKMCKYSGYEVCKNKSEADIVNKIVDRILHEINPKTLYVAKYPVGLDSHVERIAAALSWEKEGVIRFGIYGMGGMGKTTLAKALYNKLIEYKRGPFGEGLMLRRFKGSCFLANVREVSETAKGLVSLQEQVIRDIYKCKNIKVDNVDQGTQFIEARISSKVLVVIDDLDNHKQFDSLVGQFASGSVVIVTTRNEDLLDEIEVEPRYRYMVNKLNDDESFALFTQHAFGNTKPNHTLAIFSEEILRHAGGLPLALEVFGSSLYKRSEVGWKSFIEKLQRIPNSSVQQRLMISLDALESDDSMLKMIFLDISCFFIGWEKQEVVKIAETYYPYAEQKIDILKKRGLLMINNKDEFEMHDLLRDMGMNIARNNSPGEPEKHSRLWVSEDIYDVLKNRKGTDAIEGIIPGSFYHQDGDIRISFSMKTFSRMNKLRFLHLRGVNLIGSFKQTLKDLRWFRWESCPLDCLPSEFFPQKLIILELPHGKMRTMWELNTVSKVFEKLNTLNMSHSLYLTTTPDFTKLPCLQTLNLEGCTSLTEVHKSIGSMARLVSLNLRGCVNLNMLCSSDLTRLTCLETLNLGFCEKLRNLPNSICNLRALKSLNIGGCRNLEALPVGLGKIESLTKLDASRLTVLKLPHSIGCLRKLVELSLSDNKYLQTLPDTICNLQALEVLSISNCVGLKALPMKLGNIGSLKKLYADGLTVLKIPNSIGCLNKLVELRLSSNKNLCTLPDTIRKLRSLEILDVSGCGNLFVAQDRLRKITTLGDLVSSGDSLLRSLPPVIKSSNIASSLRYLNFSENDRMITLPSCVQQLSNLWGIKLRNCHHLLSVENVPSNLEVLDLYGCTSIKNLPNQFKLKRLRELHLKDCIVPKANTWWEDLSFLRELSHQGTRADDPSGLTKIQGLMDPTCTKDFHRAGCYYFLLTYMATNSTFQNVSLYLPPNTMHNYLTMILCFKHWRDDEIKRHQLDRVKYFVWTTTSRLRGSYMLQTVPCYNGSLMITVPSSIFLVREHDTWISLASNHQITGIYLLCKAESTVIG